MVNEFTWLRLETGKMLVGKLIKFLALLIFLNFTVAPQKELCSTWLVTTPVRIWSEVSNRNDALTWIWGASCVPQVAFHAARPGRDRGWGWWQDSGHSRCRSSTRSPGAGGASAGFCGTHRHISSIRFSTPNLQVQGDNTQTATLTCNSTRILHEEFIHRIPLSSLPVFKLGFSPCTNSNQQFFFHYVITIIIITKRWPVNRSQVQSHLFVEKKYRTIHFQNIYLILVYKFCIVCRGLPKRLNSLHV